MLWGVIDRWRPSEGWKEKSKPASVLMAERCAMTSAVLTRRFSRKVNREYRAENTGGQARVSRNALRHGLSRPLLSDPAMSPEVEALVQEIIEDNSDPSLRGLARSIAEAQLRIRRVRTT